MKMADVIGKGQRFIKRTVRGIEHAWKTMCAEKHAYVTIGEYKINCPSKIEVISYEKERKVYATSKGELKEGPEMAHTNFVVRNATCFVYSDIILLEDGRCIYPIKENEGWKDVVDFMDEILLKDTNTWCKLKKCHHTKHITKAIKVGGMFGFNYYHFMFQILPKLLETSDIDSSVPLLVDRAAADVASMKQLAEWCNKEKRDMIYMDYDVAYKVDELYVISEPNFCVPNWKGKDVESIPAALYSPTAIDNVSKYLLNYKDKGSYPKNIFISRRSTKRRAYNETELWDVAKQYGFVKVYPEELDMAQQMALFNNAKAIVAANGAALTNLIFCQRESSLIMFCSSKFDTSLFTSLMLMKRGNVVELYPDKLPDNYQADYRIAVKKFEQVIESVICK